MKIKVFSLSCFRSQRGSVKVEAALLVAFPALIAVPSLSFLGHSAAESLCEKPSNAIAKPEGAPQDNQVVYRAELGKCEPSVADPLDSGSASGNGGSWIVSGGWGFFFP